MAETIAVWFSCGVPSAVAAKLTIEKYGADNVRVLNNPVAEEDADNRRFLRDVENWIGKPIELVTHPKFLTASAVDVWNARKAMVFPHGAPCTTVLKKEARQIWQRTNPVDWHVLGFTFEEKARSDRFMLTEMSNVIPVLIDARMTRGMCHEMVRAARIAAPDVYARGYPNGNCIGCVKATSPTYWNHVRRDRPDVFAQRAEQSRRLGVRLVRHKGARIFLNDLPEAAAGRPLTSVSMPDCGLFCEEAAPDA